MVFISGMSVQKESAKKVIRRCRRKNVKVVAGGPLFTAAHNDFSGVDHFILNEAELTLAPFLEDLKKGCAKSLYSSPGWADMKLSPVPDWDLIDMDDYASLNIQFSRGCPHNCEFCDITELFGHKIRKKDAGQIIKELDTIYERGWKGSVFFVDDNFTVHRRALKEEILPALINWTKEREYPFGFNTQVSIDLADDRELMEMLSEAGFDTVFVGIESPNEESLVECTKTQNSGRNMIEAVKIIQRHGIEVQGGFIVGFDSDPDTIFDAQIKFIQESGIATAMVGLLNAMRGTELYRRLKKEGRLLKNVDQGNNTNFSMNFVPRMDREKLLAGYKKIVSTIYAPENYYSRVKKFLDIYRPKSKAAHKISFRYIMAFIKSIVRLGIFGKERIYYWKLLLWTLVRHPRTFPKAVTMSIYGFHFRKIFK
jgi:radical SAM superfamily enzyme YgiQ (UPF0313 family)